MVAQVLLDGVGDRLPGQAVLEIEGGDRKAVDEQAQVERAPGLVTAVAELPRDAEAVGAVLPGGLRVAGRGRAAEEVEVVRPVLDPVAQHVDGAAPSDLPVEPRQELPPRRPVLPQVERPGRLRLRLVQEDGKLGKVDAVLTIVPIRAPADPARPRPGRRLVHGVRLSGITGPPGQRRADQPLQPAFGGVGGHGSASVRRWVTMRNGVWL